MVRVTTWYPSSVRERSQGPAGVDGRQLPVVAREHQLGPGPVDVGAEPVEGAAAHERRLVDHDDVARGESASFPQVGQELGERRARDPRAGLEVGGRPGRHGGADDLVARLLPAGPGGTEHGRLPRAGLADHQVVAVARGEKGPHTVGLFSVEMGMPRQDVVDGAEGDPGRFPRRYERWRSR